MPQRSFPILFPVMFTKLSFLGSQVMIISIATDLALKSREQDPKFLLVSALAFTI